MKKVKYNVKKLLELNLLRKIPPSPKKAEESIKTAESWLIEAENNLRNRALRSCILSSYLAMFHAARAILFLKGFREKSHFAVARFLEDMFVEKGLLERKWVEILDYYREMRHEDQYSTGFVVSEEEAERAFETAEEFVERMKELFERIKS